jgi:hypothetical protein
VPARGVCDEVVAAGTPTPDTYGEEALDHFGPLDPAPSLTIKFGHGHIHAAGGPTGIGVRATRIEGGVLVSGSRSFYSKANTDDRLPVAAINHDGTVRWSRCLDGSRVIEVAVAAPEHRPANALLLIETGPNPDHTYRLVELSLATRAEQPTFGAAMQAVGVDTDSLALLDVTDVTSRYALLVGDVLPDYPATYRHIVRYDLVNDLAVDISVPAELMQSPTDRACGLLSLLDSGDVILADGDSFKRSCGVAHIATGAAIARWHDGSWSRSRSVLAGIVGIRPTFATADEPAAEVLQGVDALGRVRWTNPDFTRPGGDDYGWYLDGDIAVGQVISQSDANTPTGPLIGLNPATGKVRWTQPDVGGTVGVDPADGYVVVSRTEVIGDTWQPPGWVMLDDRTGRQVPGQIWDDPTLFILLPSRNVSGFDETVRAGGVLLLVAGDQVRVWYPQGTGGEPRNVLIP